MQVTMILPLTGQQYSEKVSENCVAIWKSLGIYTDEEAKAIEKFVSVFKDETFPPGSSILFTVSPKGLGSLTVSNAKILSLTYNMFCMILHCFEIVILLCSF
jgi:chalcone isomerase